MSKTVSTCICETNQVQGEPQENVFFYSLYRKKEDFPGEFLRSAKSTSPIQICAMFSCVGPDNIGASLNIKLNEELYRIVKTYANNSILDFNKFSQHIINTLNQKVCNTQLEAGGQNLKVSMTMLIIEGDTLRVISIGNTKAVLIRNNKIMSLTEEHTLARRYVQMNAITPEQEITHPDRYTLTQYLGMMPQDGVIRADTKVHIKLNDNDELCIMGLGLSHKMTSQLRNNILVRKMSPEEKAKEIMASAYNAKIKAGLSVIVMKVESTFIMPGEAMFANPMASDIAPNKKEKIEEDSYSELNNDNYSDINDETRPIEMGQNMESISNDKKPTSKRREVLITLGIFLASTAIGFCGVWGVLHAKEFFDKFSSTETTISDEQKVMYITDDNTPVYSEENLESTEVETLSLGDAVTILSEGNNFNKVSTSQGIEGYILKNKLSDTDPTLNINTDTRTKAESNDNTVASTKYTEEDDDVYKYEEPTTSTAPTTVFTNPTKATVEETKATEQKKETKPTETERKKEETVQTEPKKDDASKRDEPKEKNDKDKNNDTRKDDGNKPEKKEQE